MAITSLEIRDGNPWWLSTDIWAVPGDDPEGPPGQPIAGTPAYLWARVHNNGPQDVTGALVEFWWANPALQITRSLATAVGTSVVDVDAGTAVEVLCVTPWVPVTVNDGHECLVAVVVSDADPLPSPLPDVFDPPTHRQVAQRNLTVLPAPSGIAMLTLTVAAPRRLDKRSALRIRVGDPLEKEALEQLGLSRMKAAAPGMVRAGLTQGPRHCEPEERRWKEGLELEVPAGTAVPVQLFIRSDLEPGQYQVVQVVENDGSGDIGGLAVVVSSRPPSSPTDR